MSTRIWYLAADDFTSFINDLENDINAKKFDIKIIDQPTIVYIQIDKIHVGFSTFIDDFESLWYLLVESTTQKGDKLLWT